jgi:hypothetical protein
MARHLEGRLGEIERAVVVAHIRTCRDCFEVYRDAAVEMGLVATSRESTEASEPAAADLVALGIRIAGHENPGGMGSSWWNSAWMPRARWWLQWKTAGAAAAVLLVVAGAFWIRSRQGVDAGRLTPELLRPIEVAVETYSRLGEFVLPGAEEGLNGTAPVYRSGHVAENDSLSASLQTLFEGLVLERRSAGAAYWYAAGNLALGKTSLAREWAQSGCERFPDDQRLAILHAAIAREEGETARAEELLRGVNGSVLSSELMPVARYDLAVVLLERGRASEAREILRAVRESEQGEPLGLRADAILRVLAGS